MSELAEALRAVGMKTAGDRLREIALKAMAQHQDRTFLAYQAIWDDVQKSPTLMAELFKFAWHNEVQALVRRTMRDVETASRRGPLKRSVERAALSMVERIRAMERQEEIDARQAERAHQAKLDQEYHDYLAQWRCTQIGGLKIGDKFVWQHTAATVRAWLVTEKRRWRTVELLIEGLPDDDRPIEFYRRPDEINELWQRTKA